MSAIRRCLGGRVDLEQTENNSKSYPNKNIQLTEKEMRE